MRRPSPEVSPNIRRTFLQQDPNLQRPSSALYSVPVITGPVTRWLVFRRGRLESLIPKSPHLRPRSGDLQDLSHPPLHLRRFGPTPPVPPLSAANVPDPRVL